MADFECIGDALINRLADMTGNVSNAQQPSELTPQMEARVARYIRSHQVLSDSQESFSEMLQNDFTSLPLKHLKQIPPA